VAKRVAKNGGKEEKERKEELDLMEIKSSNWIIPLGVTVEANIVSRDTRAGW
jgi:hypothetical protein